MTMGISIIELSRVAGVSKSTVSRVLNQHPQVSADAVEAVNHAVEKLGYSRPRHRIGRPRRDANGVRKGSVVVLFPDTDPRALRTVLSGRLLHGIEEVFRRRGISVMITGLPDARRMPLSIEQKQVDGVLIRGQPLEGSRSMIHAALARLPVVQLFEPRGPTPPHWDVVLEDNDGVAQMAVEFLARRGRKKLAVLNPLPEHPSLRHRARTFKALADAGGAEVRVVNGTGTADEMVGRLLKTFAPDGVFVPGSDDDVVRAYRALEAGGLRPGGSPGSNVDFISCNNDTSRLTTLDPTLANIDIQAEAIGRAAADMLLWRLQHVTEPHRRLAIAPRLLDSDDVPEAVAAAPAVPAADALAN